MGSATVSRVAAICVVVLLACAAAVSHSAETRQHRIVPLQRLTQDFEVIHGNPDSAGEPFVMRIRELPGTIIPPHKHPVDEHITVVQGTLYFAVGEKFDRAAMQEIRTGGYAFIPKGSGVLLVPVPKLEDLMGIAPNADPDGYRDRNDRY